MPRLYQNASFTAMVLWYYPNGRAVPKNHFRSVANPDGLFAWWGSVLWGFLTYAITIRYFQFIAPTRCNSALGRRSEIGHSKCLTDIQLYGNISVSYDTERIKQLMDKLEKAHRIEILEARATSFRIRKEKMLDLWLTEDQSTQRSKKILVEYLVADLIIEDTISELERIKNG